MRFLFLLCSATALAQSPAVEKEVRDLVAKYVAAREKLDPAAVAALFLPEADQLVSSGEWRRGRADVVSGSIASSKGASGSRAIHVESVRLLSPGVAIADGRYEIGGSAGAPARKMWTTIVAVRSAEGWRIAAIRNMLPAPAR